MNKKISLSLLLFSFVSLVAADGDDHGMGGMMSGSYGSGMMFFGWIFGLLVLVALALLIVWLSKQILKK